MTVLLVLHILIGGAVGLADGQGVVTPNDTTGGSCSDFCQVSACLVNNTIPTNPYELVIAARAANNSIVNDSSCDQGVSSTQAFNGTVEVVMEVPLPDGTTTINLTAEEYLFVRGPRFEFFRCDSTPELTDGSRCRCCMFLVTCLVLPEGGNCSFYNQAANDDDYPQCRSPARIASNWTYASSILAATAPTTTSSPGVNATSVTTTTTSTSVCSDSLLFPQMNRIPAISDWFIMTEPDYRRAIGGLGFNSATRLAIVSPAFGHCRTYVIKNRRPSCNIEMCNHRAAAEVYFTAQAGGSGTSGSSSFATRPFVSMFVILLSTIAMMAAM